jgi:hypothetical protein
MDTHFLEEAVTFIFYPEDGGSRLLGNVGTHLLPSPFSG